MNKGFIASSLLYGMLALFLVIMISTIYILSNNKLSMDKLKENALTSVETGYVKSDSTLAIYDGYEEIVNNTWFDQSRSGNDSTVINVVKGVNFLNLNNGSYINTHIKQSDLGEKFTIMTTFQIDNFSNDNYFLKIANNDLNLNIYTINQNLRICYINGIIRCTDIPNSKIHNKINLALTFNEKTGFLVYLNGNLQSSLIINKPFTLNENELLIGKSNNDYFKGKLYGFIVYNDELTEDNIKTNFDIDNKKYKILTN